MTQKNISLIQSGVCKKKILFNYEFIEDILTMNIYAIIIIVTILLESLLSFVADLLNLKNLSGKLPKEFESVYDAETYKNSQAYTRVNTKFGFITTIFELTLTFAFWFSGGFNFLDQLVRNWELNSIWTGLVYIGILVLLKSIISLQFSIYVTFAHIHFTCLHCKSSLLWFYSWL